MKSPNNRVRKYYDTTLIAGKIKSHAGVVLKSAVEANDFLEDELREVAANWDVDKRMDLSKTFARWADQLYESAMIMNPQIKLPEAPKIPRGFFLVNLAKWREKELRKLAKENEVPLRGIIRWAINKASFELKERLDFSKLAGVKVSECWRFINGKQEN